MLNFIITSIEKSQVDERENSMFTEANIVSNQLIGEYDDLSRDYTREYYSNIIMNYSREISSRIIVLNDSSQVLIDTFGEFDLYSELPNNEALKALEGERISIIYDDEPVGKVMYVALPIEKQGQVTGVVLMVASLEDIYSNINTLESQFLFLALVCVAFTTLTSFIFVEILSSPIEKLTESVNQVSFGGKDEAIQMEGSDEIKVLSNSFHAMLEKLNLVDAQRKQLVADVSHELRTPLTSIKLLSTSLLGDDNPDPAIYKEFLTDIDSEIDRLNGIIDSLLYLFDLEKDETEIELDYYSLNTLVDRVTTLLQPIADQKHVTIQLVALKEIKAYFDREKMYQCLLNLMANAIKYNTDGGQVKVLIKELEETIFISVEDDGYGIEAEALPYIFERFYRTDKARNRKTGGTGLGLSIVQQIVNLHGGSITVDSIINEGTTFKIEIPKGRESYE